MAPWGLIMQPDDRAWLVLGAGILAWDLTCPPGQTLSDAAARYHRARPWTARLLVAYLAGHLLGWWPACGDPLRAITHWKCRLLLH